jgi:hypothetical protein
MNLSSPGCFSYSGLYFHGSDAGFFLPQINFWIVGPCERLWVFMDGELAPLRELHITHDMLEAGFETVTRSFKWFSPLKS